MVCNQLLYLILHLISDFWFSWDELDTQWSCGNELTTFQTYLFEDVGLGHQVSQDGVTEMWCFQTQVVFMLCCAIDYC